MTANTKESDDLESRIRAARILVVDDNEDQLDLMAVMLNRHGYTKVDLTSDPKSVAAAYAAWPYDLILLDMEMPVMNGIEFVKAAKALPAYKFLPILMLTTESQDEKKEQGKAAGAKAWMLKPFSPSTLIWSSSNPAPRIMVTTSVIALVSSFSDLSATSMLNVIPSGLIRT